MFDWNDEELTNIIWGEAGESDDHIVPYPDQIEEKPSVLFGDATKKEINLQTSNISRVEQKKPTIKSEYAAELDSSPKYDTCEPVTGFGLDSLPDGPETSSSTAAKADQESIDVGASSNITSSSKNVSIRDETAQFVKESEILENAPEDREEHGDFVDYSWANIGSFDDLDRIFSKNDPIFGESSVGNVDELWSASKDVTSSPLGSNLLCGDSCDLPLGPSRTSVDGYEIKDHHMLVPSQSFISGYEKLHVIASQTPEDVQASLDTNENSGGKSNLLVKEKGNNHQKRLLKGQILGKKSPLQQVNSHCTPKIINPCPPLVLTQQRPFQRPEPFRQNHLLPGLSLASPLYGNMASHCSGYEVPSTNANSSNYSANAPTMTPREKIEKLRRRQQMRAMLAIQKQQLQFGNQVSVSECSGMEGAEMEVDENRNRFLSVEPNTPLEQYDSNAISMTFDNCSVEESVIYWLQDTISKLDIRIKLCIRDSLFRLAQNAVQRQYPNDASSTRISSRDEVGLERFNRMPDVETDTNPIDRAVAHLLFHRPLELSGKPADAPQSPVSANLQDQMKVETSKMK